VVSSPVRKRTGSATGSGDRRDGATSEGAVPAATAAEVERFQRALRALQRENACLRLLVAIHDRLSALVLQGADVPSITAVLCELVGRPVLVLDPLLRPLAIELPRRGTADEDDPTPPIVWEPKDAYVSRVLETIAGERRPLRLPPLPAWGVRYGCAIAPIVVGDTTLGYAAILDDEQDAARDGPAAEATLLAAQHAASVYAVALMREHMAAEVTSQLKQELFESLLLGEVTNVQAAHERARRLGYNDRLSYRVLSLAPDRVAPRGQQGTEETTWSTTRRRRLLASLAEFTRQRAPHAIVAVRREELVVLAPESAEPGPAELGRLAVLHTASLYPDFLLTVGVGGLCRSPTDINRSYSQARRAVDVARRFGRRGQVVPFEELGLYRLLFQVADPAELRAFVEDVLGPLLAYDRKHQTDFVRTLATYLANNNSLQATARELMVHVNTMTYRVQRIQAITGLDLTRAEDCLLARVALKILEGIEAP
jgi:sugar diacid utilization regulator